MRSFTDARAVRPSRAARRDQLAAATSLPALMMPMAVARMPTPVWSNAKSPSRPWYLVPRIASASSLPVATLLVFSAVSRICVPS